MRTIRLNNYEIFKDQLKVECDKQELTCLAAAEKVYQISHQTLGYLDSICYSIIDFLARFSKWFKLRQFLIVGGMATTIINDQKMFLEKRQEIESLVKKNFDVVATNVDHLDEAEVVCLGENHISVKNRIDNAHLIDRLCERDDLILTETEESDPIRHSQAKYVRSPLKIKGWDQLGPSTKKGLDDACIAAILTAFAGISAALNATFFEYALTIAAMKKGYDALQNIVDDLPARNRSLCRKIDSLSKDGRRLYAIAGFSHLQPVEKEGFFRRLFCKGLFPFADQNPQDVAYRETLASLQKRKFAILVPKDF